MTGSRASRIGLDVWCWFYAVTVIGAPYLPVLFGADLRSLGQLQATVMFVATIPPVGLVLLLTSRMRVERKRVTVLSARLPAAFGIVWGGVTFTLGAFLATLLAADLDRLTPADDTVAYFYRTLQTFMVPLIWAATVAIVVPAAWRFATASTSARERALLRLLPVLRCAPLTLAVRMWVDDPDFGARPQLTSARQEWWLRELSTRALAWTLFLGAVMCALAGLSVAVLVGEALT